MSELGDKTVYPALNAARNLCDRHRKFLVLLLLAVILRCVFSWFVTHHDTISWLKTVQNVEAGVGLYQLEGLWYTPIFGYILSFMTGLGDLLGLFPIQYASVPEFIWAGYNNLPDPGFNFFIKIPMLLGDIIVAVILYKLVSEYKDEKWALIITALWLLSPIVWHMSAAQGQFDALCIGLFLISFLCLRKDQFVLSGLFLALSVWLKIFPVLCGPLMLIYIYNKAIDKEQMKKNITMFLVGIIATTAVVFLPQILNGELIESFNFFTSRTIGANNSLVDTLKSYRIYASIFIVAIFLFVLSKKYSKCRPEKSERMLFVYSAFIIACGASICMDYQYTPNIIFCIIILVLAIPSKRKVFIGSFALVSIVTYLEAARHIGQMHFAIAAVFYKWFDIQTLANDYYAMTVNTESAFMVLTGIWQIITIATMVFAFVCFIWPNKVGIREVEDEIGQ